MDEQSRREFIDNIKKVKGKRNNTLRSYKMRDYFFYYRKIKPKKKSYVLTELQYGDIIESVNEKIVQRYLTVGEFILPYRMGTLAIRKRDCTPRLDSNGDLKFPSPIDWRSTLNLWAENPDAHESKVLIKNGQSYCYTQMYVKNKAKYNNKKFFRFKFSRGLKMRVKDAITNGSLDAFIIE